MSAAIGTAPGPAFELRGVDKRHGAITALEGVHLAIGRASTTALVGPSGSGKSTALRLLLGLDWPDAGEVRMDGAPLSRQGLLAHRRGIGYVIQEGGLFPHLTAAANVGLLARTAGWTKARIDARAAELSELCQLPPDALVRYPAELSGGQRQRVGLVRALMLDPPVLLLDEPLAALDPIVRHELQAQMRALFAALGKTVVLVTHDVAEAAFLSERLVLLRAGRVVQAGSARHLLDAPAEPFVTAFMHAQRRLGDAS